ncbi:MAG: YceI family protein [Caldilineaceae bacterium]|nr:YceI family protein [Caldilineaceae bacterium]
MLQVNVRNRRFWVVLLSLISVVVIAACAGGAPAAPAQPAVEEAPVAAVEATEAPAAEVAEEAEASEAPAQEAAAASGTTTFVIDPAQSEVRFTLTELLMGTPTTVIGRGNGVEGSVTVDFGDYSQSSISPIVIDASTLATDNNMRNGQIRRAILQTNQPEFQYITFTPSAVEGLPGNVAVGESFDLLVTGDLTIRTITQPMSFEVTVTPLSETELRGSARATLLRADFDLQIPRVPSVADVSEEVMLEFDFVAVAQ